MLPGNAETFGKSVECTDVRDEPFCEGQCYQGMLRHLAKVWNLIELMAQQPCVRDLRYDSGRNMGRKDMLASLKSLTNNSTLAKNDIGPPSPLHLLLKQ